MPARLAPPTVFAGLTLAAATLQVVATVDLGLARLDTLARSTSTSATPYLFAGCVVVLGLALVYALPRRPIVLLTIGATVATSLWALSSRLSWLGIALHGEFVLHHFCALMGFFTCLALARAWFFDATLGRWRVPAAGLTCVAASVLLVAHLLQLVPISVPQAFQLGTLAFVATVVAALVLLWLRGGRGPASIAVTIIAAPFLVRIFSAWPQSLTGGPVPDDVRFALVATVVAASLAAFFTTRPTGSWTTRAFAVLLSGLASAFVYLLYLRGFGELEDGISGLAHSLLGFTPPYPQYVEHWQVLAIMVAIFCILYVVYLELMSNDRRTHGIALGLVAVTGVGLTQPQLMLMATAGLLLTIHEHLTSPTRAPQRPPQEPMEDILRRSAHELGLPDPVVLNTDKRPIIAIKGEVGGSPVDLRARPRGANAWTLILRAGVRGRGRPEVSLLPDIEARGDRPTHALGLTHRIGGSVRSLERVDEPTLDALLPFPDATLRLWPAGAELDFGRDLHALESTTLSTLVRSLGSR